MFPGMQNWLRRSWLLIAVLTLSCAIAGAQQITATLSGIAADQTDARIPGAAVKVVNEATGDVRETKADSSGLFAVTALIPGTYTVVVSAKGFATFKETGILLNQGDSRTVPNIRLKVSSDVNAVTVISGADAEVPVDTAEVSATLNTELVDSATLTGRNAAELIKMMPGVTYNNGGGAGSGYNSKVTGTNNGPAGSFSANGTQPYGSTDVYLDGANLIDPGNAGTQVANINQDMTDSVKYLSASYGAEYAKGPAVLQAFSKSGGQKYHGEAYFYARNTSVGFANDWYNKYSEESAAYAKGDTKAQAQATNQISPEHYYYVGGNIGGPIALGKFNRNKDKLFFWGGYEKMFQAPYSSPVFMNVPTVEQQAGNFDPTVALNGGSVVPTGVWDPVKQTGTYGATYGLPCQTDDYWQGCQAANSPFRLTTADSNGHYAAIQNLKGYFDPYGKILSNLNPQPNVTPISNNNYNNYEYSPSLPVNRWEATGKVTYAFNENNKIWGSYAYQTEGDSHPLSIWWAPTWELPYAGNPSGTETANVYLANYTHVFSATTTNEFVFAYSKFENKNTLSSLSKVTNATLGLPAQSIYGSGANAKNISDQMPGMVGGWSSGLTATGYMQDFNSGIYGKGSFGKTSKAPSFADTFTRVVKTHSIKAGFYWDAQENLQADGALLNGEYDYSNWGGSSTNNETLNRYMSRVTNYSEYSKDAVPDVLWHQWSIWAQDSWKVSPKFTVNLGLRMDHMGQWYDKIGGTQVWDVTKYDNTSSAAANTGLQWNAKDSSVPKSGWKSDLLLPDPRVGFAYDVKGNGRTVIRGGFGIYRYQVSGGDASHAMTGPIGEYSYGTQANGGVSGIYSLNISGGTLCTSSLITANVNNCLATTKLTPPTALNQIGSTVNADKKGDSAVPYADTYSFGVAQALPGHTVAEVSYVGSLGKNQLLYGSNGHIQDANAIPYGAFFMEDPVTGASISPDTKGFTQNDYRPYAHYTDIYLVTHGGHANYNSLQVSAQKQSGNLFIFTNFTFGKVLGTRDGSTSNGNGNGPVIDPYNLENNYGPLEYDHTKAFNFSWSYKLPKPVKNNWLLGEAINGWQLSGYGNYQDGVPYQTTSPNMNGTYYQQKDSNGNLTQTFTMPSGKTATSLDTSVWFGSSQYENGLQEVLVCDPRKGLKSGQQFNPNCFVSPMGPTGSSFGQQGQYIWPYFRTPHFVNLDAALFKAFKITDSQRAELRISASNVLNHPNAAFGVAGTSDNLLQFTGASTASNLVYNNNVNTTGKPLAKNGYRWIQFAAKYYF